MVLCFGIWCHGLEIIFIDNAHAPALHLLEKTAGLHTAHEHDHFKGFDVRTGGDHVHGNGNPGMITVSEFRDEIFRLFPGCLVGDFLSKIIPLCKFLTHDFNNVFSVAVIFCKNQGLGHLGAAGKNFRKKLVPKCTDNRAYLILCNHITVKFVGIIFKIFIQLLPANFSGFPVANINIIAGFHI